MLNTLQLKKVVIALSKFLVYLVDLLLEKHSSKNIRTLTGKKTFEVSVVTMVTLVTFFFVCSYQLVLFQLFYTSFFKW